MESSEKHISNRYSDADLAEFKAIIDKKLAASMEQVESLREQVTGLNESLQTSGADLGDNSGYTDVEFLNRMILRQKKHIRDLENALLRIKNKNYGICSLTGNLIDKKRLMVVPTTTKGLEAKTEAQRREAEKSNPRRTLVSDRRPKNPNRIVKKKEKKIAPIPLENDDDEIVFNLDDKVYEGDNKDIKELGGDIPLDEGPSDIA